MKDGQSFIIKYTKLNGEEVERKAKFILGKCGEYISKAGNKLFTYFDVDQSNHSFPLPLFKSLEVRK